MSKPTAITRFAPSPTGELHLGHAYSALFSEKAARDAGGRFLLRIEDIDRTRCKPGFEVALLEILAWLGISWDEQPRRQSDHLEDYQATLVSLAERDLVYPCFCTRKDIQAAGNAPHGPDGPIYPGTCRGLSATEVEDRKASGLAFALRLKTDEAVRQAGPLSWCDADQGRQEAEPQVFGDVVLARKDVPTSYHLSVCHDDALQGVTLVTRGLDLFEATHVHRLIQALMDWPQPHYHHHRLLTDETGRRFAKRDRSLTLRSLRESGRTAASIRSELGFD
ncbi:MAG: tRNA glutamyl-Q(34) synthetase GluQRS [Magnetovibrionaceae bacterium]